jgi:hypothetical protein
MASSAITAVSGLSTRRRPTPPAAQQSGQTHDQAAAARAGGSAGGYACGDAGAMAPARPAPPPHTLGAGTARRRGQRRGQRPREAHRLAKQGGQEPRVAVPATRSTRAARSNDRCRGSKGHHSHHRERYPPFPRAGWPGPTAAARSPGPAPEAKELGGHEQGQVEEPERPHGTCREAGWADAPRGRRRPRTRIRRRPRAGRAGATRPCPVPTADRPPTRRARGPPRGPRLPHERPGRAASPGQARRGERMQRQQ